MALNLLESVLLGLLARHPRAGYDLRRYLERNGRIYGYSPQGSQIYRQLASLVGDGLLEYEIDTARSGPDAKVYSLTAAGSAAFVAWAEAPFEPSDRPLDAHFQVHFLLAGSVSPLLALRIVETELAFRLAQEERHAATGFAEAEEMTMPAVDGGAFDPIWAEEISFLGEARGNMLAAAHISWLATTRRRLARVVARADAASHIPLSE